MKKECYLIITHTHAQHNNNYYTFLFLLVCFNYFSSKLSLINLSFLFQATRDLIAQVPLFLLSFLQLPMGYPN